MSVLTVFVAAIMPTGRISLYALSSFYISVIIIESGIKYGIVFYFASSFAAFLLIPAKLDILPYFIFFGCYGLIKYLIEKLDKIWLEYILKLVYFNIVLAALYYFAVTFIFEDLTSNDGVLLWVVLAAAQIIFVVYDYVYTLFISYYKDKIKRILRI